MTALKRIWRGIDSAFEAFALLCLTTCVLVVLWQVFGRQVLGDSPSWSEEVARILMVWTGFLATAIGFREGSHIAITFIVDRMPKIAQLVIGRLIQLMVLIFAVYLVVQGAQFTSDASAATLPGTGWPRSVVYVIMPVAGVMIGAYTILQAAGVQTHRHDEPAEME